MQRGGLTFSEMQNRVALAVDATTGEDGTPTDAKVAALIKNAINDAIVSVYGSHDWTFRKAEISIVVGEDSPNLVSASNLTKYNLPAGAVGSPVGRVTIVAPNSQCSDFLSVAGYDAVRRSINDSPTTTGRPRVIAFAQPFDATTSLTQRRSWEMHVYPAPDAAYTITGVFEMGPAKFVQQTEVGPWTPDIDHVVVARAVCIFADRGKVPATMSRVELEQKYLAMLAEAKRQDNDRKPRSRDRAQSFITHRNVAPFYIGDTLIGA